MTMPDWKKLRRTGAVAAAAATVLVIGGCNQFAGIPKHMRPLDSNTVALLEKKDMKKESPILIRIFKQEAELEVWKKQTSTGRYALFKTYDICKWSGELGPKFKEGDRQAPEGFYTITPGLMNPNSSYHLAFNLGYPNTYDKAHGRTGSHLMVHGACSSRGCYSMNDEQIQEIYTLARLAFTGGQRSFQVQAYPFQMTPENMATNRDSRHLEFWRMLKEGNDHFVVTGQPPSVDVCSKRYVFNAVPQDGVKFNSTAECPQMSVPDSIQLAVAARQRRDEAKTEQIVAKLEARENGSGPLRALFGRTAIANADQAQQSTPTSYAVVAEPEQGPASPAYTAPSDASAPSQTASIVPTPKPEEEEEPAKDDSPVANAYALETEQDTGTDGFINTLMNRIW